MQQTTKATQLVRPISNSQFQACEDALQQLTDLGPDARIKVLSIAGVSRQGKSTLLELLAGRMGAFKIADGTDPCTEGIHMLIAPEGDSKNSFLVRFPWDTRFATIVQRRLCMDFQGCIACHIDFMSALYLFSVLE